jgi:hypothetical protein
MRLAILQITRQVARLDNSESSSLMRATLAQQPIMSVAALPGVRELLGALLLVVVLIITPILGAVSAPAS